MILNIPLPQILKIITVASASQSQWPVGGCIGDRGRCKAQSDTDDDRSGYNRRQETHNASYTDNFDDQGQKQVEQSGNQYTAACVRKFFTVAHVCKDARVQICDCLETTQKGRKKNREMPVL